MATPIEAALLNSISKAAVKAFEKELENPKSSLNKQLVDLLNGTNGQPGIYKNIFEGLTPKMPTPVANPSSSQPDPAQTEQELIRNMRRYMKSPAEHVATGVANVAANAASGLGNAFGAANIGLGDAILAMTRSPGNYVNPGANAAAAFAAGKTTRGTVGKVIGDSVANTIKSIVGDVDASRERDKQTELLLRERPSGQFFDSRKQLTKLGAGK